ncbi:MAG: hypothetical protein JXA42_02375 [Anaerolineales bacterium]|nr:hypothetical protein [Anaerolineales bacterium]
MDREFALTVDGKQFKIEMQGNSLLVDGTPYVIGYDKGVLTVDGITYEVSLGEDIALVDGQEYRIEAAGMQVKAEPPKAARKKQDTRAGVDTVVAIMPGAILQVRVAEGAEVHEGDVVVILEAMKMENEIHAHKTGRVMKVFVDVGDSVENGQPLVEIK